MGVEVEGVGRMRPADLARRLACPTEEVLPSLCLFRLTNLEPCFARKVTAPQEVSHGIFWQAEWGRAGHVGLRVDVARVGCMRPSDLAMRLSQRTRYARARERET